MSKERWMLSGFGLYYACALKIEFFNSPSKCTYSIQFDQLAYKNTNKIEGIKQIYSKTEHNISEKILFDKIKKEFVSYWNQKPISSLLNISVDLTKQDDVTCYYKSQLNQEEIDNLLKKIAQDAFEIKKIEVPEPESSGCSIF